MTALCQHPHWKDPTADHGPGRSTGWGRSGSLKPRPPVETRSSVDRPDPTPSTADIKVQEHPTHIPTDAIWAITTVRNEEDVITPVIRHLLGEGVDRVLVADNMSTDRTRPLLEALAAEHAVTILDDPDPAHRHGEKMTALAHRAGSEGAAWIIPFDADELWVVAGGTTLREYLLSHGDADVVVGDWYHHYAPLLPGRGGPFARMVWRDERPDSWTKVAFRYRPDVVVVMGNHDVEAPVPLRRLHDGFLQVHHYRYRNLQQMIRKCRHGTQALELAGFPPEVGGHWRFHSRQSKLRVAAHWSKMALVRRGRVRDRRLPTEML
jgi:Glycosyl transferase family 2